MVCIADLLPQNINREAVLRHRHVVYFQQFMEPAVTVYTREWHGEDHSYEPYSGKRVPGITIKTRCVA